MAFGLSREARFNRYFEGYERRTIVDRNGQERTKFVYIKEYYRPKMSEGAFTGRKVLNIVLFLIAAAAQVYAGFASLPMNSVKYMGFAQCLGILGMILLAVYLITHMSAAYTMEIHAYKGAHEKLTIAGMLVTIGFGAIFIAALVAMIICKSYTFMSFIWLLMYLIAACAILIIWLLEKRTDYDILPPNPQY